MAIVALLLEKLFVTTLKFLFFQTSNMCLFYFQYNECIEWKWNEKTEKMK